MRSYFSIEGELTKKEFKRHGGKEIIGYQEGKPVKIFPQVPDEDSLILRAGDNNSSTLEKLSRFGLWVRQAGAKCKIGTGEILVTFIPIK